MHKNRGVKMRQLDDGIGDTLVFSEAAEAQAAAEKGGIGKILLVA
jgi:hypothetical protein